jgi:hypothetical protein
MITVAKATKRQHFAEAMSGEVPLMREILALLHLPEGWYFGSGDPPSLTTATYAISVAGTLHEAGAESLECFPDCDGGILVSGYHGDESVEILCRPSGVFDFVLERSEDEVDSAPDLDMRETQRRIRALKWREESLYDFYIRGILAEPKVGIKAWPSRTPQVVAYPLLMEVASLRREYISAGTSQHTIQWKSQATPQSFGDFGKTSFLEITP